MVELVQNINDDKKDLWQWLQVRASYVSDMEILAE